MTKSSRSATSTAGASPARANSVTDGVYERLRGEIMTGRLPSGQKLSIRAVAERYGVSLTPVREAMKRLVAEGGIEVQANRTFRLPELRGRRQRELLDLRCELEGRAAALAAARMSASSLKRLQVLDRKLHRALERGELQAVRDLNRAFHFELYRRADHHALLDLIENLWLRYASGYALPAAEAGGERRLVHHRRLLHALEAGDCEGARGAIEADLRTGAR